MPHKNAGSPRADAAEMVRLLLDAGADVDARTPAEVRTRALRPYGYTPL
ncbi:MAG: hypothetical protein JF605_06855, partial [Burkholderia sp.]|nr:hypothetical protein [Burkholderia sp.]